MKTRILIEMEIECADPEDAFDIAEHLLDTGQIQDLFNREEDKEMDDGAMLVTSAVVSKLEGDLGEILWPGGNAEAEWNPDTIEAVARRLEYLRPSAPPIDAEGY